MDAVIFDVDGVLTDSEPLHFAAVGKVLAPFGKSLSEEDNKAYLGFSLPDFWREMAGRFDLDADPRELSARHEEEVTALIREGIVPLPGVARTVTGLLMRGLALATASSSPKTVVEAILEGLGLLGSFPVRICGDQVERAKPHPGLFLEAARALGISPERCMVIEDSPAGILAARRAGMFTVAVLNRYNQDLDLGEADRVFSGLERFDWTLFEER